MEENMQNNNIDLNNNGIPDKFEYQDSSDLVDFKLQGNAFDNAYENEEQIAKNIPDYKQYQWYREPNEGYFYSLGQKLENKIESGEITPNELPENSAIQKEAEQLTDSNPNNDEVNNKKIESSFRNPEERRKLLKLSNKELKKRLPKEPKLLDNLLKDLDSSGEYESFYDSKVFGDADLNDKLDPALLDLVNKYPDLKYSELASNPEAFKYYTESSKHRSKRLEELGFTEDELEGSGASLEELVDIAGDMYFSNPEKYTKEALEGLIESNPEESKEMLEQIADTSDEISEKDVEPLVKEADQLNDSNPHNDEVNNEAIDDFFKNVDDENVEEKIKKIGGFLPDIGTKDFMSFADSTDEEKTKNPHVPEKIEESVKDDIKKDIDNEEDLLWFEQLTQEPKKEKKADKKRKKEENKNWIENQTLEDLDAIKEDFEQYDVPATMSDNVPAEIYDNENLGGEVGPWNSAVGPARNLSDYINDENLKFAGESWLTDDEIDDIVEESSPNADEETKERRKKILRKFKLAVAKANPNLLDVNSTEIKTKENPNIKSGVHPSKLNVSKMGGAGVSISKTRSSPPKEKGDDYHSKAGGGDIEPGVPETTNKGKFSGSTNSVHQSDHLSQTMDKIGKSAKNIKTGSANLSGKEGHTSSNKTGKVPSIDRNINITSIKEKIIGLSKGWPIEKEYRYSGPKYLPFKFWVKDDTVEIGQIGTGRHRQSLETFIKKEPGALQQLRKVLK